VHNIMVVSSGEFSKYYTTCDQVKNYVERNCAIVE